MPAGLNASKSDSIAVGGLVVRNEVSGGVDAYLANTVATAASLDVQANENAAIQVKVESAVSASGGSAYGTGTVIAVNGTIATNLVLSHADAYLEGSQITTTGDPNTNNNGTKTGTVNVENTAEPIAK